MDNFRNLPVFSICLIIITTALAQQDSPADFVAAHNAARATIGVPPLAWNATVAAYAQAYAQNRSRDCAMIHSGGPYGENIAWGSWAMSAADAVNMWVGEKKIYEQDPGNCLQALTCAHYTQVMWRSTTGLGCATSSCVNGNTFVTCNYDPPGNYLGQRPY